MAIAFGYWLLTIALGYGYCLWLWILATGYRYLHNGHYGYNYWLWIKGNGNQGLQIFSSQSIFPL
jgi:hypothetical protein